MPMATASRIRDVIQGLFRHVMLSVICYRDRTLSAALSRMQKAKHCGCSSSISTLFYCKKSPRFLHFLQRSKSIIFLHHDHRIDAAISSYQQMYHCFLITTCSILLTDPSLLCFLQGGFERRIGWAALGVRQGQGRWDRYQVFPGYYTYVLRCHHQRKTIYRQNRIFFLR